MKNYLFAALIAIAMVACDKDLQADPTPSSEAVLSNAEPAVGDKNIRSAPSDSVEVAASGTKFDPPIEAEKLPDGAWYCDMGTVHYAQMEKGDGKCAVCGMALKQHSGKHMQDETGAHEMGEHMDDGHAH